MLKRGFAVLALVSVSGVFALQERTAEACGGCFSPPTENTVVDAHRMAFALSKTQTVLWDQFNYSGDPKEFAWVLPVRPGTRVELSHDEFIAALEAATQPIIVGPQPQNTGGGGGCGSATLSSAGYGPNANDNVVVISQQVVGPYEVVTLKATAPNALVNWLTSHGYAIPPGIQPTLDAYVNEGFDFVALRLLPNKGVSAMKPVRVVSPGADVTLPLRMVAAGIGAKVGVVLYVLGEGRYEAANYPNVTVDFASNLSWDSNQNRSNYTELVTAALAGGDGRGWFTEFADYAFNQRYNQFTGAVGPSSGLPTLESAYASAIPSNCTTNPFDAGPVFDSGGPKPDASSDASSDASGDASSDGATSDASAPPDAGPTDAGLPPAPNNDCTFDDITVATTGMTRADVWISRLRANLPATVLSVDLKLQAASPQTQLNGIYQAVAPGHGDGCTTAQNGGSDGTVVTVGLGALGLSILLRRRRRAS